MILLINIYIHMWSSGSIPKVKNFMWRATHATLPVMSELAKRDIQTQPTCMFCHEEEIVTYAILCCGWVRRVWFGGMVLRLNMTNGTQWGDSLKIMQDVTNVGGE